MRKLIRYSFAAIAILSFSIQASAEGDCYRHSECDEDEVCIDKECATSESPLDSCDGTDSCDSDDYSCDDGFCKKDGVYCDNPAGYCYIEATSENCSCFSGESFSMGLVAAPGAEVDIPSFTDAELYEQCLDTLTQGCGEEGFEIDEECTDEEFNNCEEILEKLNQFVETCGDEHDEPGEVNDYAIASCCHDFDDEDFEGVYNCIMALESDDCEGFDACRPDRRASAGGDDMEGTSSKSDGDMLGATDGDHADTKSDNEETQEDDKDDDNDDDDSGCTVAPALGKDSHHLRFSLPILFTLLFISRVTFRRRRTLVDNNARTERTQVPGLSKI